MSPALNTTLMTPPPDMEAQQQLLIPYPYPYYYHLLPPDHHSPFYHHSRSSSFPPPAAAPAAPILLLADDAEDSLSATADDRDRDPVLISKINGGIETSTPSPPPIHALPPPPVAAHQTSLAAVPDRRSGGMSLVGSSVRTSIYRGVTRHRWTGRYEAHLWDNTCKREGQKRKGRQVYLGGYDKEEKAARAYDLAAIKYWGISAVTNFPIDHYAREIEEMQNMTKQEFVASIRRKSSGFSRGASIYRGVTRHHQHGRWQARIGRVAGNKDLYLGTFASEEEAAEAYDVAAIKFRGNNAVTNFELSRYDLDAIACSDLPIGPSGRKPKVAAQPATNSSTQISFDRSSPLAAPISNAVAPAFFRNFLQLSASELMVSFPPMLTFGDTGPVPVSQGFLAFPDGYEQKGHQQNTLPIGTGLLQLANVSVSMSQ